MDKMNNINKTSLSGVFKINLENFSDDRGNIINLSDFHPQNLKYSIDKLTISKKNVLRGFHGDSLNDKLIFCLKGKIKLAVVNYNKYDNEYLKHEMFEISEKDNFAIFVPKNFLNAHYCITDDVFFFYRWTYGYIKPEEQISVRWNSPTLNINWNLETNPIISKRDSESL